METHTVDILNSFNKEIKKLEISNSNIEGLLDLKEFTQIKSLIVQIISLLN